MKRIGLFLVVIAATWCLSTGLTLPRDCDSTVVDEAGVLGSQASQVEQAAQGLVSVGADVRVLVIRTFGSSGNLDRYEEQVRQGCGSWQASDGDRKNNMVIILLAVDDKKVGIYGGGLWEEELSSHTDQVRSEEMGPRFRQDDWAGGLTAALNRITQYIQDYRAAERNAGSRTPSVIVQTPTDYSGLFRFLMWLLGAVVVIGAVVAFIVLLLQSKKEKEARSAARQRALAAKAKCTNALSALREPMGLHDSLITALASKCADEDLQPLKSLVAALDADYRTASMTFTDSSTTTNDPEPEGRSVDEYQSIRRAYDEQYQVLSGIQSRSSDLSNSIGSLKKAADGAAKRLEDARSMISEVDEAIQGISQKGFKTAEAKAALQEARTTLNQAHDALSNRRITAFTEALVLALLQAEVAQKIAEALPSTAQALAERHAALGTQAEAAKSSLQSARETFERITTDYVESSWQVIRGNGTEAEVRYHAVLSSLAAAGASLTMEQQQWTDAKKALDDVETGLKEMASLLRSITQLEQNLAKAKRDAQQEIRDAHEDIQKARQYIHEFDDDVSKELETELRTADQRVQEAEAELEQRKPDYLKVVKLARDANTSADIILDHAQKEHEAAERKRRRAASAIRDAKASVSAAKEYIQDHASDVDSDANDELAEAVQILASALATHALDQQIKNGESAQKQAQRALELAQNDVEEEEEKRRRRARERAESHRDWGTHSVSTGSVFSSSRSSGHSSGSSGSSFGSSGSFGGGKSFGSSGGW